MGRYSGNGMGSAFRAYWPPARSGAAMQRDLDKRHRRDPETIAAVRELRRIEKLNPRLHKLVQGAEMTGAHPLDILDALVGEIRHADRCATALKDSKK